MLHDAISRLVAEVATAKIEAEADAEVAAMDSELAALVEACAVPRDHPLDGGVDALAANLCAGTTLRFAITPSMSRTTVAHSHVCNHMCWVPCFR